MAFCLLRLRGLQISDLPSETLARLYRFSLLLQGDVNAAVRAFSSGLKGANPKLGQIRNPQLGKAFLIGKVREACLNPAPGNGELNAEAVDFPPEFGALVAAFSSIQEPDRSALALFYLELLPVAESAALVRMNLEEFSLAVERGRSRLREAGLA